MKLKPSHDFAMDAMLKEWGRWRRADLAEAAPRNPLRGASWQRQIRDEDEWEEIAHRIDQEPDAEQCERIQVAYERLKREDTGYEVVLRDWYVEETGWPPANLLRYARYLIWKHGG